VPSTVAYQKENMTISVICTFHFIHWNHEYELRTSWWVNYWFIGIGPRYQIGINPRDSPVIVAYSSLSSVLYPNFTLSQDDSVYTIKLSKKSSGSLNNIVMVEYSTPAGRDNNYRSIKWTCKFLSAKYCSLPKRRYDDFM
jgi:hypothetical protein